MTGNSSKLKFEEDVSKKYKELQRLKQKSNNSTLDIPKNNIERNVSNSSINKNNSYLDYQRKNKQAASKSNTSLNHTLNPTNESLGKQLSNTHASNMSNSSFNYVNTQDSLQDTRNINLEDSNRQKRKNSNQDSNRSNNESDRVSQGRNDRNSNHQGSVKENLKLDLSSLHGYKNNHDKAKEAESKTNLNLTNMTMHSALNDKNKYNIERSRSTAKITDNANNNNNNTSNSKITDEFANIQNKIKTKSLSTDEVTQISNYAVKLLNFLEIPIKDPSLISHKQNNLKHEFLTLREKQESSKNRLRIQEKNIMNLNRDVKKQESKWMNIVRNSTYQDRNIEQMNETIANLESKLDQMTQTLYQQSNDYGDQIYHKNITNSNKQTNDTNSNSKFDIKLKDIKSVRDETTERIVNQAEVEINQKIKSSSMHAEKLDIKKEKEKDKDSTSNDEEKKLGSSMRSDLTSMLNEITKVNSNNTPVESKPVVKDELNIVKNLVKINNNQTKEDKRYAKESENTRETDKLKIKLNTSNSNRSLGRYEKSTYEEALDKQSKNKFDNIKNNSKFGKQIDLSLVNRSNLNNKDSNSHSSLVKNNSNENVTTAKHLDLLNESKNLLQNQNNNTNGNSNSSRKKPKTLNDTNSMQKNQSDQEDFKSQMDVSNLNKLESTGNNHNLNSTGGLNSTLDNKSATQGNSSSAMDMNAMKQKYRKEPVVFDTFRNPEFQFKDSKSNSLHNTINNTLKLQEDTATSNLPTECLNSHAQSYIQHKLNFVKDECDKEFEQIMRASKSRDTKDLQVNDHLFSKTNNQSMHFDKIQQGKVEKLPERQNNVQRYKVNVRESNGNVSKSLLDNSDLCMVGSNSKNAAVPRTRHDLDANEDSDIKKLTKGIREDMDGWKARDPSRISNNDDVQFQESIGHGRNQTNFANIIKEVNQSNNRDKHSQPSNNQINNNHKNSSSLEIDKMEQSVNTYKSNQNEKYQTSNKVFVELNSNVNSTVQQTRTQKDDKDVLSMSRNDAMEQSLNQSRNLIKEFKQKEREKENTQTQAIKSQLKQEIHGIQKEEKAEGQEERNTNLRRLLERANDILKK